MNARPPELLRRLLAALLPAGPVREGLVGDLDELYADRARRGRIRAVAWYARQVVSAAVRYRGGQPTASRQGRERFAGLTLDIKLGVRMLLKYPGLSVVGGLAMGFAIFAGAVVFEIVSLYVNPTLPLPNGGRVVQIYNWDVAAGRPERRIMHDFVSWRGAVRTVEDLGAWGDARRTLIVGDGEGRPVEVAEITASGFRVAGATPLLGRVLSAEDERPGASPVAAIGYDLWRTRFEGDPDAIGRVVTLGQEQATVVGVMPEGFAFPVSHDVWVPLQTDIAGQLPRSGSSIRVFGVLASDASLEAARAEMAALGRRMARESPASHEYLTPRVEPYVEAFSSLAAGEVGLLLSIDLFVIMLLLVVCGNVALLLFARAAARENELVVRSAIGASRGRIVAQMFVEALVLGGVAALIGLAAASFALGRWGAAFLEANEGQLPFWFDLRLSPGTVVFAIGLTVLGSAVAGILPGWKVTRGMASRLRQAAPGAGGLRFGGIWTAVIVVQVAVTVAFPSIVYIHHWSVRHIQTFEAGFAAEDYLTARIDRELQSFETDTQSARLGQEASFAAMIDELRERFVGEPGVIGVTFVDRVPRTGHPDYDIEVDGAAPLTARSPDGWEQSPQRPEADVAHIDPSYFEVLRAPMLAGRAFRVGDLASGERVAIVDRSFVDQVLGGQNAIGRRVRFLDDAPFLSDDESDAWYEIVGVAKDLGMGRPSKRGRAAGLYLPATGGRINPLHIMVHTRSDPMTLAPRLREIAAEVDPALMVSEVRGADDVLSEELWVNQLWLRATILMTAIALLLSLSGIYAVLSFNVSRRTREIGVRVALGAERVRVFAEIFRRPLTRVGLGVLAGSLLIATGATMAPGTNFSFAEGLASGWSLRRFGMLVGYAAFLFGVCLLACVVPTRRALSVEPTRALQAD